MQDYDYIRDGDAIYAQSFAIIRAEADLSAFSVGEADLAVRMIHAAGSVEAAQYFEFGPGFVEAATGALAKGAPIFCDAEMVSRGVTAAKGLDAGAGVAKGSTGANGVAPRRTATACFAASSPCCASQSSSAS